MPDYGYPKTKKNVNTRISEYTELIGTNGMHPVAEGSYMIADGILPIFTLFGLMTARGAGRLFLREALRPQKLAL